MNSIQLSPDAREALGRTSVATHKALTHGVRSLAALNARSVRTGAPIFAGIPFAEKTKRRAAGKVAKASRKANR